MTGAKNDIDFPPMMIYSLPTPFYLDRLIDHKLMEKTICEGLKKLEACGVSFIAMPCNTAHVYFERLQKCIHVPLLNMVSVTLNAVPRLARAIAILGTRQTLDSEIFQKGLREAALRYVTYPKWQEKVDAMILKIKIDGDIKASIGLWEELSKDFILEQVDTILLACSDLNVIFRHIVAPFQVIDSSICLAQAIVNRWKDSEKHDS